MIEDFLWWVAEKSWPMVFVCVFKHFGTRGLDRSGRGRHHSTRRNGGRTMVPIVERLVPSGTCHVSMCQPLQRNFLMRLHAKPVDGYDKDFVGRWPPLEDKIRLGKRWWLPLGTLHRQLPIDFINSLIPHVPCWNMHKCTCTNPTC